MAIRLAQLAGLVRAMDIDKAAARIDDLTIGRDALIATGSSPSSQRMRVVIRLSSGVVHSEASFPVG